MIYSDALDEGGFGLLILDSQGQVVTWNAWLAAVSGIDETQALGRSLDALFPRLGESRLLASSAAILAGEKADGYCSRLHFDNFPQELDPREIQGASDLVRVQIEPLDLSDRYCLIQFIQQNLSYSNGDVAQTWPCDKEKLRIQVILSSIDDAVIVMGPDGVVEFTNTSAEQYTGWSSGQAQGRSFQEVFNAFEKGSSSPLVNQVDKYLEVGEIFANRYELVLINRIGVTTSIEATFTPIHDREGDLDGIVLVFRDVSKTRKLAAKISWQTNHDRLTGLLNRTAFDQKLDALLKQTKSEGGEHAMLYLDLDQFKVVNDTCGHVAGDELLRQVSSLLSAQVRSDDTLARLGGDEFAVLLKGCPKERMMAIANKMRQAVREFRYVWAGQTFALSVSIGAVAFSADSPSMEAILSAADTACYAAKEEGRDRVHLFRTDQGEAAQRQGEMQWANRINIALDENRFVLYVQPIEPLSDSGDKGHYEVLVRMLDERGSIVPPGLFIPAAERFNLMPRIDRWVVQRLFQLIRQHYAFLVGGQFRFAINLSGASISDEDTLNYIGEQLIENAIPEGMISFEITETAAVANLSSANYFIRTLKQSGCAFALDDFGSGLSSFAYLKNLPVDYLKIDGTFVKDMVLDPIDSAMVEAINRIGHVMQIKTIAEFAENEEILERLRYIGVDYAQGYGISRPMPLTDSHGRLLLVEDCLSSCE